MSCFVPSLVLYPNDLSNAARSRRKLESTTEGVATTILWLAVRHYSLLIDRWLLCLTDDMQGFIEPCLASKSACNSERAY